MATRAQPTPAAGSVPRNAVLLGAATVAARLGALALAAVLARALGPEGYGVYALAMALATILIPLADLGLTPYLARDAAREPAVARARLPAAARAKALASGLLLAASTGVALAIADGTSTALAAAALIAAGLADGGALLAFGYLQGRERMGFEARATTAAALARVLGGAALAVTTEELLPVAAWVLLVSLVLLAFAARALARDGSAPATASAPAIAWRTAATLGVLSLAVAVYLRVDTVIVAALRDTADAGRYAAAATVVLGLAIPSWTVVQALLPVLARTLRDDRDAFASAWRTGLRAVLVISLPLALVASLHAEPLLRRCFGPEFASAGPALAILAWSGPLGAAGALAQAVLRASDRDRATTAIAVACALASVALTLAAVALAGLEGAAIVRVVTEALSTAALVAVAARAGLLAPPRLAPAGLLLALAACAGAALALRGLPVEAGLAGSLAAFALVAYATGAARPEHVAALRALSRAR